MGIEFYLGNVKNVFSIDSGDVYTTLLVYIMTLSSDDNYYYVYLP